MKHYWINPGGESERARWMAREFARTGLPNRRVAACTPRTLAPMLLPRDVRQSPLQLACLGSHFAALRQAVNDAEAAFMIMEDDMTLSFCVDFPALLAAAPPDWDILQLHVVNADEIERMYTRVYGAGLLWERWTPRNFSCGAYVVSGCAAQRLLGTYLRRGVLDFSAYTHPLVADDVIYRTAQTYTLTYPLYIERSTFPSTIGSRPDVHLASRAAIRRIWKTGTSPPFAVRQARQDRSGWRWLFRKKEPQVIARTSS